MNQNVFKKVVAPLAMLSVAVLGGTACSNPLSDEDNSIKNCPDKYEAVSVEVESAAPVIKAFAMLANETVVDDLYGSQDPYDLSNKSSYETVDGANEKVDEANEVVCVVGEKVYLNERSLNIVGGAEADGFVIDFEKGTAKLPEEQN